jgi:hypothetical protein
MAVGVEGSRMKVRVQVIIESDSGEQACIEEVASLRREALQPEDGDVLELWISC